MRLLLAEDSETCALRFEEIARQSGHISSVRRVSSLGDAMHLLETDCRDFELVVFDLNLLDANGNDVINRLNEITHQQVVIYTGTHDSAIARAAGKRGALFCLKQEDSSVILSAICNAVGFAEIKEKARLAQRQQATRERRSGVVEFVLWLVLIGLVLANWFQNLR